MSESFRDHSEKLKNLKRLANQMASMHSMEAESYDRWNIGLDIGTLVSSVFMLSLSLACEDFVKRTLGIAPDNFKWIMAFWAAFTFSVTVARLAWRPAQISARHVEAVHRYARIKHQIATALEGDEPVSLEAFRMLQHSYLDSNDLPPIRNRRFNRLKQSHLLKVECSRCLDRNPHESLRSIKKRLSRMAKEASASLSTDGRHDSKS